MRRLALVLSAALVGLSSPACSDPPAGQIEVLSSETGPSRQVTAAALAALPQQEVEAGGRRYTGPRLRDALAAELAAPDAAVEAVAADGYRATLSPEAARRDDAIIAVGLPADEGPLRLVVPGSKGLGVKRLAALKVVSDRAPAP